MPSILLEPSDHRSGDKVLSCGRALPHISLCYSEVASLLHVLHSSYCDKM